VPIILVKFSENLNFLYGFSGSKPTEVSDLMKICPVGAELFHADRLTDKETYEEAKSCF